MQSSPCTVKAFRLTKGVWVHPQKNAPPLFFGAGKQQLLFTPALAVVGSRQAKENELQYTRELGRAAAEQGYSVISGGARGVDENAMLGALEAGGTSIGILSGNLFSAISSKKYRQYINNGDLVLISPYNPEAGFSIGNAMGRNKYIYCLADGNLERRFRKFKTPLDSPVGGAV